jgi:uncharacterized protein
MHRFLRLFSVPVTRWPAKVLVVVVALVAVLGTFLPSLSMEVDLTEFRSDSSESGQAMEIVESSFIDAGSFIQIIVDAGPDGNVLSEEGLAALQQVDELVLATAGDEIRSGAEGGPQIRSIPSITSEALAQQGVAVASADRQQTSLAISRILDERRDLAELTSTDRDLERGTAQAAVSIVALDPSLDSAAREDVSNRLQEVLEDPSVDALSGLDIMVVSESLFEDSIESSTREEAPMLFGLALLVIVGILGFTYRAVLDTVIGLLGLILTIIGTFGIAALMGPAHLGVTGPLSQLAVLVPVLLIGLGVDFAVHLTTRYKEQLASGDGPQRAAQRAIHTVGAALVLASAATVVGFGANAFAPLQITADFALQIALGILVAFLVMGFAVPAARVLIDRRKQLVQEDNVKQLSRSDWVMNQPTNLALRAPLVGAIVAVLLGSGSLVAAMDLEISFDRDDFVPAGSHAEVLRDRQDVLFGGQLDDVTYVVVEGNLTDPALVNAMIEAEGSLGNVPGIATVSGEPQIRSIGSVLSATLDSGASQAGPGESVSAEAVGWTGSGFDEHADLGMLYDVIGQQVAGTEFELFVHPSYSSSLTQIQTTAGDAGAGELRDDLLAAYVPVEEAGGTVHVTSASMIMSEMSDELAGFQLQSLGTTLVIVLAILAGYYGIARRQVSLGLIAMIPALVSASLLLGTMWVLEISVNAVTATMTAIAVGIGVPFGVHVVNRFAEQISAGASAEEAARVTLQQTGRAIVGSGLTTFGAFLVLSFANLGPVQQLGLLGAFGIAFALLSSLFVMPGVLILWERRRQRSAWRNVLRPTSEPNAGQ